MSKALSTASRTLAASSRRFPSQHRFYATPVNDHGYPPSKDPMLAGYPDVPFVNYQERRPKGWDDVQDRRNIGEVVPEQFEALSMWTPDPPTITTKESAARQVGLAVLAFVSFGLAVKALTPDRVSAPRDYPYDGLREQLGGLDQNKAQPLPEDID